MVEPLLWKPGSLKLKFEEKGVYLLPNMKERQFSKTPVLLLLLIILITIIIMVLIITLINIITATVL